MDIKLPTMPSSCRIATAGVHGWQRSALDGTSYRHGQHSFDYVQVGDTHTTAEIGSRERFAGIK